MPKIEPADAAEIERAIDCAMRLTEALHEVARSRCDACDAYGVKFAIDHAISIERFARQLRTRFL